jgi:hypothetical protein
VDATKTNVDLADFDLIVISEVAASTATRIASLKSMDKPTLTMKVHAYKEANGTWGWAKNGFGDNYEATSIEVTEQGKNHPIFAGVELDADSQLQMVSEVNNKALTYMNPADFISVTGGDIVELANIAGEEQCNIFEVPSGTSIAGSKLNATMIQIGLNSSSYANITDAGTAIVKNACYYLLDLPVGTGSPTGLLTMVSSSSDIACYPNPVEELLFVQNLSDRAIEGDMLLFDLSGTLIHSSKVELSIGTTVFGREQFNNMCGGTYLLMFVEKNNIIFKRITIFK